MNESLAGEYRQSTGKQIVIRITCHSFNQSVSPVGRRVGRSTPLHLHLRICGGRAEEV